MVKIIGDIIWSMPISAPSKLHKVFRSTDVQGAIKFTLYSIVKRHIVFKVSIAVNGITYFSALLFVTTKGSMFLGVLQTQCTAGVSCD
jgi:hypothetical protein